MVAPALATPALQSWNTDLSGQAGDIAQRQQALDSDIASGSAKKEAELQPLEQAETAALAQPMPSTPKPTALPEWKDRPVIDSKEYESFATVLLALSAIGGAKSKGNWMQVGQSLNGAMEGYIDGNQEKYNKAVEDYKRQYESAKAHDEQANKEFQDILENRKLSINEKIQAYKVAATKWERWDAYEAARQKSIDSMQNQLYARQNALHKADQGNTQFTIKLDAGLAKKGEGAGSSSPEDRESRGAQASTGQPLNQIVPGYSKEAIAQRAQARSDAIKKIQTDMGLSAADAGIELANRTIEFQSGKKSDAQLTTMEGATRAALKQLDFNISKVSEEMKKLPSTDISPVLNAIARGEEKWTGDPAYSGLFFYMYAAATESARITSGGAASVAQLHEGAREEAKQWADINMTPASWNEVASAMHAEGENRLQNFRAARGEQRVGTGSRGAAEDTPPTKALPSKAASDWIARAMKANPGMTREQVVAEGRKIGKLSATDQ